MSFAGSLFTKWMSHSIAVSASVMMIVGVHLFKENAELQSLIAEQIDSRSIPPSLVPFGPLLENNTNILRGVATASGKRRRLVLIGSDVCPHTAANLLKWKSLLKSKTRDNRVDVWYVTFDTTRLGESLDDTNGPQGATIDLRRVTDARHFVLRTGILGTPYTLLIDSNGRIELSQAGVLSDASVTAFTEALQHQHTLRAFPFLQAHEQTEFREPQ